MNKSKEGEREYQNYSGSSMNTCALGLESDIFVVIITDLMLLLIIII